MANSPFQRWSPRFRSSRQSAERAIAAQTILAAGLVLAGREPVSAGIAQEFSASRWFKGNLHTHTVNSDGDSTPDEVVRSNGGVAWTQPVMIRP